MARMRCASEERLARLVSAALEHRTTYFQVLTNPAAADRLGRDVERARGDWISARMQDGRTRVLATHCPKGCDYSRCGVARVTALAIITTLLTLPSVRTSRGWGHLMGGDHDKLELVPRHELRT
jgi:hypothetical protein